MNYNLDTTKSELITYALLTTFLFGFYGVKDGIVPLLFFSILVRLSLWDLKYKEIPHYLLLLAFFTSFFVTDYSFFESFKNGMIYCGAIFMLNQIIVYYINNIKIRIVKDVEPVDTALGEGDIPIIASIGVIFGLEIGVTCLVISSLIAILFIVFNKETEHPFVPSLSLSIFICFVFPVELIKIF